MNNSTKMKTERMFC